MEEMKTNYQKPMDRSLALAVSSASFAWASGVPLNEKKTKNKR